MKRLDRITFDPNVMGGKPCIRGMRVTVGTITGLVAAGRNTSDILGLYPYLETRALIAVDERRERVRLRPLGDV